LVDEWKGLEWQAVSCVRFQSGLVITSVSSGVSGITYMFVVNLLKLDSFYFCCHSSVTLIPVKEKMRGVRFLTRNFGEEK
jgi:hypothetical protein